MSTLIAEYTKGKRRKENSDYSKYSKKKVDLGKKFGQAKIAGNNKLASDLLENWKSLGEIQRTFPSKDQHDPNFRRLWYCR